MIPRHNRIKSIEDESNKILSIIESPLTPSIEREKMQDVYLDMQSKIDDIFGL